MIACSSVPNAGWVVRSAASFAGYVGAIALLATNVAFADPIALTTPGGLNPGDRFRFLFVTSGLTDATSTDITTYNAFVQAQAGGATYNAATVNWKAIGSTAAVDARDNVGGFGTPVPVYRPDGAMVFSDMTTTGNGLWSGSLDNRADVMIDSTVIPISDFPASTFTGSDADGTQFTGVALGDSSVLTGTPFTRDGQWMNYQLLFNWRTNRMYGVSEELTVAPVPEPSTCVLALAGLAAGGFSMWRRRKPV